MTLLYTFLALRLHPEKTHVFKSWVVNRQPPPEFLRQCGKPMPRNFAFKRADDAGQQQLHIILLYGQKHLESDWTIRKAVLRNQSALLDQIWQNYMY